MFIIEKRGSSQAMFFSLEFGRNVGNPLGGWVPEIAKATVFDTQAEAEQYLQTRLEFQAPDCKVRFLPGEPPGNLVCLAGGKSQGAT